MGVDKRNHLFAPGLTPRVAGRHLSLLRLRGAEDAHLRKAFQLRGRALHSLEVLHPGRQVRVVVWERKESLH